MLDLKKIFFYCSGFCHIIHYAIYFKVYFVWNKDCNSSILLVSIHMEYLFLSFSFQSVCVSSSEVDLL